MRIERTAALAIAILGFALSACSYSSRPVPGGVTCGDGTRKCPDGYTCYTGALGNNCANTCWPEGEPLPTATTTCPVVPTDDGAAGADGPGTGGTTGTGGRGGATGTAGTTGAAGTSGTSGTAGRGGTSGTTGAAGTTGTGGATDAGTDGPRDAATDVPVTCSPACGAHAKCMVSGATATCVCVAGYVMTNGVCTWGTVPQDPGFQNMPTGAWKLEQGAVLNAAAGGNIELGDLEFSKSVLCTSRGRSRQSITMPTFADSGIFALKVASNGDCTGNGGFSCTGAGAAVVINGGANLFNFNALSAIQLGCLGERSYGGTFDVVVRPSSRAACTSATTLDFFVDHVDIEPSTTCPTPGTLPDGNFDATVNNWTTSVATANSPPPIAEIQAGTGTAGTKAGHVFTGDFCQQAMIQGPISPPLTSIPNLAMQLSYKGTSGEKATVQIAGTRLAVLPGTGVFQTGKVCLPETSKGMTETAVIGILLPFGSGGVGCGMHTKDFLIDDMQFVSDATCAATAWIPDGGFERTDPIPMWDGAISNNGAAGGLAAAAVDAAAANAHGGTHSLKLVNNVGCGSSAATFAVGVPPSAGTSGPALTFFYKAPLLTSSNVTVTAGTGASGNLAAANAYTQVQICLDPTTAGQTIPVLINMTGNGTLGCSQVYTAESIWFDDFAVGTNAACQGD
jgi:hypothetical protein